MGYAMIPGWIFGRGLSATAIALYVLLAEYGTYRGETGTYEECRPSRTTMARRLGVSVETVKRGLGELVDSGAVIRRARTDPASGARLPSVYTVQAGTIMPPPVPPSAPSTVGEGYPQPRVLSLIHI